MLDAAEPYDEVAGRGNAAFGSLAINAASIVHVHVDEWCSAWGRLARLRFRMRIMNARMWRLAVGLVVVGQHGFKRGAIVLGVVLLVICSAGSAGTRADAVPAGTAHPFRGGVFDAGPGVTIEPDRLLVRFRTGVSATQEAQVRRSMGGTLVRSYRLVPGLELVRVPRAGPGPEVLDAVASLSHNAAVRYATPDVAYHLQATPDDPLYGEQWGMESIDAPEAWDRSTGSKSVMVAVLDSGITLNHPDLEANIWTNPNPGQDGYVNDVHGWNFVSNNNNPFDDFGHGTHVAGIIGAVGNNGIGVTGVNWSVSLMPLKICNSEGLCELSDEITALEYAVDHGAKVANASFGGAYGGYKPEEEAIQAAGNAGLLYVAAAGNNATSNDVLRFYPASYPLNNIISVAATTSSNVLASFSNFGVRSVNLGAPGQEIWSTLPTSGTFYSSSTGYGELSGTSMAVPQVAGAAALLWSLHPSWTMQQIRSRLLTTVRPLSSLFGKVSSCGELDLAAASDPGVPEQASLCLTRIGTGSGSVTSSPAGIDCGASCSVTFAPGTHVTLTATPAAGSTFAGWLGACTGTGSCTVSPTMTASVTAMFRTSGTPAGWEEQPLAPPSERVPLAPQSSVAFSFYNVSLSADGTVRAKTIYNLPSSECSYATSDTGGVFLEHKTASGWVSDGSVTAPALGSDSGARWANCSSYGAVTELSGDGSTLLVSPRMDGVYTPELGSRYRCAAFVYRHGESGWALDGTLFPPGVGATGSPSAEGCDAFGAGGAISDNGTRVAVMSDGRVDVFLRGTSGWSLEQHILLPEGPGCSGGIAPREIALSSDGAELLVGGSECEISGHGASGRVYAYTRSGFTWSLVQTIESPEPQFQNDFGRSIAISDDGSTATFNVGPQATGLEREAGAAWVFEHNAGGWQAATRLTAPTPEEGGYFGCPTVIENGSRIICRASDTIGFDSHQGAIYMFERPLGGWMSSGSSPTRLFATDGAAGDELGSTGPQGWPAFAAAADGSLIDATISIANLANGTYPNDRIGYEFTTALPSPPTITKLSPTSGAVNSSVTITGTNLRGASTVSFNATKTSSYSIDSDMQITATVPAGATAGPISVTTRGGTATSASNFTVVTSLETTASGPVVAGEKIHDTATLLGGSSPTGTISFQLYAGSDKECSKPIGEALGTSVTNGNGTYESPAITENTPGSYQWVVSYSGDANNASTRSACNDSHEQVTVQTQPSIATTASGTVTVGEEIHDTATLLGGSSPTGTISFQLYASSDKACSTLIGAAVNTSVTNGNGAYESPAITENTPGSYQWVVSYSGDANNASTRSACNDPHEQVTVKAQTKPAVLSESASDETLTTAVLTGTIKPELAKARYYFEYGETKAFGQSTAGGEVPASAGEVPIGPETITGLKPGTTYYYRLRVVNTSSETVGEAKTFTTPTPTSSPIVPTITPFLIPTTPITTTTTVPAGPVTNTLAFSGLLLPAAQHGRSLSVELIVDLARSSVEVDVTAPAAQVSLVKRKGMSTPVVLARLVRASVAAGRLKLIVPLNDKGKRALKRHKHMTLTVQITVTPPVGQPQTATRMVTLFPWSAFHSRVNLSVRLGRINDAA
jgi:subtilisin family serine protease